MGGYGGGNGVIEVGRDGGIYRGGDKVIYRGRDRGRDEGRKLCEYGEIIGWKYWLRGIGRGVRRTNM